MKICRNRNILVNLLIYFGFLVAPRCRSSIHPHVASSWCSMCEKNLFLQIQRLSDGGERSHAAKGQRDGEEGWETEEEVAWWPSHTERPLPPAGHQTPWQVRRNKQRGNWVYQTYRYIYRCIDGEMQSTVDLSRWQICTYFTRNELWSVLKKPPTEREIKKTKFFFISHHLIHYTLAHLYVFSSTTWIYSTCNLPLFLFPFFLKCSITSWSTDAEADLESKVQKSKTLYAELFNQVPL